MTRTEQMGLTGTITDYGAISFRNKIINGNFDFWQRGTSQTSSGYGSADRWHNSHLGTTRTTSQQACTPGQTSIPGEPTYYIRHVVSSVAGAPNYCVSAQAIENVRTLAGKTATLTFWASADTNRNIVVEILQYFGTGGSPSSTVTSIGVTTCALTTSWQKFTVAVSIPSILGKTLGTNNDHYLQVLFWFDAGSNYNSRTNSLGQQSGTFDIAQVQLEEGTVATPFEDRPKQVELALCQRYTTMLSACLIGGYGLAGNTSYYGFALPVAMRNTPTVTFSNVTASNMGTLLNSSSGANVMRVSSVFSANGHGYCNFIALLNAEL